MAMPGVEQPAHIQVDEALRLRRYDGTADFALSWYEDEEMVYLVDGVRKAYDREALYAMYGWLDAHGLSLPAVVGRVGSSRWQMSVSIWGIHQRSF